MQKKKYWILTSMPTPKLPEGEMYWDREADYCYTSDFILFTTKEECVKHIGRFVNDFQAIEVEVTLKDK